MSDTKKAYYSKKLGKFHREVDEVCEFYVDENNKPQTRIIYQKLFNQEPVMRKPSPHLIEYLENQNIDINAITEHLSDDLPFHDDEEREEYMEEHQATSDENSQATTNSSVPQVANITPVVQSTVQQPVAQTVPSNDVSAQSTAGVSTVTVTPSASVVAASTPSVDNAPTPSVAAETSSSVGIVPTSSEGSGVTTPVDFNSLGNLE